MSQQQTEPATITNVNEKKKKQRLSLPNGPTTDIKPALRTTQSFNKPRPLSGVRTVEPIPEVEVNEEEETNKQHVKRNGSDRASQVSKIKKLHMAHENGGFESENGTNLKRAASKTSLSPSVFERGSASARSSTRTSNTISLQVQQEQYCCCARWSPCEKKLASCVAILATIILILVIVVGVLAGDNKGVDVKMVHPMLL